jgi:hypothetical protein
MVVNKTDEIIKRKITVLVNKVEREALVGMKLKRERIVNQVQTGSRAQDLGYNMTLRIFALSPYPNFLITHLLISTLLVVVFTSIKAALNQANRQGLYLSVQ